MRHCAISEEEVDFQEHCVRVILASIVTWALAKHNFSSLRKSSMLPSLDFMPLDQIDHISLNGLRRRVETHDKTQSGTQMHGSSVALD
jgi:hypothetical protein